MSLFSHLSHDTADALRAKEPDAQAEHNAEPVTSL